METDSKTANGGDSSRPIYHPIYRAYPGKPRKRQRTTPDQAKILEDVFRRTRHPSSVERLQLASKLAMAPRRVQVWFQNRRAKERNELYGSAIPYPDYEQDDYPSSPEDCDDKLEEIQKKKRSKKSPKDYTFSPHMSLHALSTTASMISASESSSSSMDPYSRNYPYAQYPTHFALSSMEQIPRQSSPQLYSPRQQISMHQGPNIIPTPEEAHHQSSPQPNYYYDRHVVAYQVAENMAPHANQYSPNSNRGNFMLPPPNSNDSKHALASLTAMMLQPSAMPPVSLPQQFNGGLSYLNPLNPCTQSAFSPSNRFASPLPAYSALPPSNVEIPIHQMVPAPLTRAPGDKVASLLMAAEVGDVKTVKQLLSEGVHPSASQGHNYTALHAAVKGGHCDIVAVLLGHPETDVNLPETKELETPLHIAALRGHATLTKMLLAAGAVPGVFDKTKRTPLHHACLYGHLEAVRELLKFNAPLEARDAEEHTPLQAACLYGYHEAVKLMLEAGANVTARDSNNHTALYYATVGKHEKTVEYLKNHGAKLEDDEE